MRLPHFSIYALDLLVYLNRNRDRLVTIHEVADARGVSHNHMMKVAQRLRTLGYIHAIRGRGGGLRLGPRPETITLGEVIWRTGGGLAQNGHGGAGQPPCGLDAVMAEAAAAFRQSLNRHTVADLTARPGIVATAAPEFLARPDACGRAATWAAWRP
jgi:Rrf2 family transcriptional regulator, nitric oxide-sensitive transcriptional repressor